MELNIFLKKYFNQLTTKNISNKNNFNNYENFKNFIEEHYNLHHIELYNYIKYIKIKRQIIKINNGVEYDKYINEINSNIKILFELNIFPNIIINKYLCKIDVFYKLLEKRKDVLLTNLNKMRLIMIFKNNYDFKIKILNIINNFLYKFMIFNKITKKILYYLNELLNLESSYGIDHKLIRLANMEHDILGKKSEFTVNKILNKYIFDKNIDEKKYFYETNIDLLKLFNIELNNICNIKGEIDGIIFYYDGCDYIIEKIIEVKSSIKSTFDDIKKFIFLQEYINNLPFDSDYTYNNYKFTKKSFVNIIGKKISDWTIYICVNNIYKDSVEKSHLYFSGILKILDDIFIKEFYVNNNEKIIIEKYNIIVKNRKLINNLFKDWKENIKLNNSECNVYISKNL